MIKDNRIIFGFGTIGVKATLHKISFAYIEPPQTIGVNVNEKDVIKKDELSFFITNSDYLYLLGELNKLETKDDKTFIFKDYIFDFNQYNKSSIEVVKNSLEDTVFQATLAFAC